MKNLKLTEIRALYRAYQTADIGQDYLKKAVNNAINFYLTLYIINFAANGNTSNNIDITYREYYDYGKSLYSIINYNMTPEQIYKLQGSIEVPF